jgi:hypothetical protein
VLDIDSSVRIGFLAHVRMPCPHAHPCIAVDLPFAWFSSFMQSAAA